MGERDFIKITTDILPQICPKEISQREKLVFSSMCLMTVERGTGQWRVTTADLEMVRAWGLQGSGKIEGTTETDYDSVDQEEEADGTENEERSGYL